MTADKRDREPRLTAARHRAGATEHDRGRLFDGEHDRLALGRFRPIPEITSDRIVLENVNDCSANLDSGSGIGVVRAKRHQEIARALQLREAVRAA